MMLALFIISRNLKHYFQTFPITILGASPVKLIKNSKATGRILKWALELRHYGLRYESTTVRVGLADFIADFT